VFYRAVLWLSSLMFTEIMLEVVMAIVDTEDSGVVVTGFIIQFADDLSINL